MARAFRTLVGGARRWVRLPLAAPSTSESTRRETDDREGASASREGTSANHEDASANHEDTSANHEGTPSSRYEPSDDHEGGVDGRGLDEGLGATTDQGDAPDDSSGEMEPDERIRAALTANGGRLAQRDIPAVADLSQSAASRRLIAMEERGEVVRYEIGRGKTVFLPGEEPAAFRSPIEGGDADPATTP